MYDFHTQYGIKRQRGHGRHDANGSVIRFRSGVQIFVTQNV